MTKFSSAAAALAIGLLSAGLSACVSPTPYQPAVLGGPNAGGFAETKIEADRWRVTFSGNAATPRNTVESYLLFRAAELTLQNGYDWFSIDDRQTDSKSRSYVVPGYGPGYGPGFGYWRPTWRFEDSRYGWRTWDPYYGGPYWGGDVQTLRAFEASAEIITHKGAKPADDPRAFDAHAVVENLKPKIHYPAAK